MSFFRAGFAELPQPQVNSSSGKEETISWAKTPVLKSFDILDDDDEDTETTYLNNNEAKEEDNTVSS